MNPTSKQYPDTPPGAGEEFDVILRNILIDFKLATKERDQQNTSTVWQDQSDIYAGATAKIEALIAQAAEDGEARGWHKGIADLQRADHECLCTDDDECDLHAALNEKILNQPTIWPPTPGDQDGGKL